jgi:predicted AlkP superfamily pyrophosphatase or phosphodiesterase
VASLAWPTTVGAAIPLLVPDIAPARGRTWVESLQGAATPRILDLLREAGGAGLRADAPAAARDAVLVDVACRLLEEATPTDLLLLHLSSTREAVARAGLDAPATRLAFAAADAEVARVLACLSRSKRLARSAVAVAGDHGAIPLHTLVTPNTVLVHAGLGTPDPRSNGLQRWSALARSNGGSAFVYAEGEDDALLARRALEDESERTGAFRIVPASTMLRLGADPSAWFGIEAEPGYAFSDETSGPRLVAAAAHAVGGYLPDRVEMDVGFVAFGPGLRRGLRVPRMGLVDVAPTLARLVGLALPEADGHVLVGLLEAAGG